MKEKMTNIEIAQHLITEDLKFHRLHQHLAEVDIICEYYPDMATAVQQLLAPNLNEAGQQEWNDLYVHLMGEASLKKPESNPELSFKTEELILNKLMR